MFQFPSNGKVYSKADTCTRRNTDTRFNSLQTGKCIQRPCTAQLEYRKDKRFQFPSNGKVYSKECRIANCGSLDTRFNSLQTGKCIQRLVPLAFSEEAGFSFNSLQTGKCIQRGGESLKENCSPQCFNSLQTGKCIQS